MTLIVACSIFFASLVVGAVVLNYYATEYADRSKP